jgi:hypothetical protein
MVDDDVTAGRFESHSTDWALLSPNIKWLLDGSLAATKSLGVGEAEESLGAR